jgi:hypothetical protein
MVSSARAVRTLAVPSTDGRLGRSVLKRTAIVAAVAEASLADAHRCVAVGSENGPGDRSRTCGVRGWSPLLWPLSYTRVSC